MDRYCRRHHMPVDRPWCIGLINPNFCTGYQKPVPVKVRVKSVTTQRVVVRRRNFHPEKNFD